MTNIENIEADDYPLVDVDVPMCNLAKDSKEVIKNVDKIVEEYERQRYAEFWGGYYQSAYDDDDDDWDDVYGDGTSSAYDVDGWKKHYNGFGMTDEEWDEWQQGIREYESAITNFEKATGHSIRGTKGDGKKKKGMKSQKFINGIEVDDETFDSYNKDDKESSSKTRRGGRKHKGSRTVEYINGVRVESSPNKKRKTKYVDDEWWEEHEKDRDSYMDRNREDYEKDIIFYRNLPDKTDTYEWDNLFDFANWVEENEIEISDELAYDMMYASEVHCCLSPDSTDKVMIMGNSYDDLAYVATSGDLSVLEDPTNHWNFHGV